MTRSIKIPDASHPITIEPTGARVTARVNGVVVADTTAALTLREASYPPVQYIPLADVDPALIRPTDTQTYCPFKGDASYYTLAVGETEIVDAIWTYRAPYPAVADIAGRVAFYPNEVDITIG
jgi:uncharacterized protein (DUF427 family)